jgi:DAACS family dicarboxylate/amino acid:cation (Na+ or H+) symporter
MAAALRRIPLYGWIFIGLVVGVGTGILARSMFPAEDLKWTADNVFTPIGKIFIRLIFMTVVPLIFTALAIGVGGLGELAKLGRVGIKTLVFTVLVSLIAVGIGIGLVRLVEPGKGLSAEAQAKLNETYAKAKAGSVSHVEQAKKAKPLSQTLLEIIPENPLEDAATAFNAPRGGGLLSVMFFALVFGLALALSDSEKTQPVVRFLEGLYEVLMKIIGWAMTLAPLGVGCLMFSLTATMGTEFLAPLAKFVGVVLLGLFIHQFVVYSMILRGLVGVSPFAFFRRIQEIMLTAFATASSNATLPTSLRVSQGQLGIPREISNFVLTLGSTANQNGTALFEGVVVLFLAQFLGHDLSFGQQIVVVLMSVLAGVGTAGVPGGSLPMIVILMQSIGLDGAAIVIVLGVDRILDMCRTTVNVTGDVTIAAYVARSEGHELKLADPS